MSIQLTKAEQDAMQAASVFTDTSEMYKWAPSLFATEAHPKMSPKYAFTNTYDIILHMHNKGMRVVSVSGGDRRYKKVMVRMRCTHHSNTYAGTYAGQAQQTDNAPELIIIDSHDGSSRLKICMGFIRFVCMNGMITGDLFYNASFVHSKPDLMAHVMLELRDIDQHVERLIQRITAMRNYQTTFGDRIVLADAIVRQRWGEEKDASFIAEMRQRMLEPRREEDLSNDLYTIMNVLQENVLRGGMTYTNNNNRAVLVRSISNVSDTVHINQQLWNAAEQLLQKAA